VIQREVSQCGACKKFFDDAETTPCPHCEAADWDYPSDDVMFCPNSACDYHRAPVETNSPHCERCSTGKNKTRLVTAKAFMQLDNPKEEEATGSAENRLKAKIQQANNFVKGSGTHHRSKSGKHTKAASEKHSGAGHGKKITRDKYAKQLQELIDELMKEDPESSLLKEGENVRKAVLNK
jgi:hypothetical protein